MKCVEINPSVVAALISVAVTIVISFIRYCIDKNGRNKSLELYRVLIVNWIRCSLNDIDILAKRIESLRDDIKKSDSFAPCPYNTTVIDFERITSLPYDKVSDALLINLNIKKCEQNDASSNLYHLMSNLKFFQTENKFINMRYVQYQGAVNKLLSDWIECFKKLGNDINNNYLIMESLNENEKRIYSEAAEVMLNITMEQIEHTERTGRREYYSLSSYCSKFDKLFKECMLYDVKKEPKILAFNAILNDLSVIEGGYDNVRNQYYEVFDQIDCQIQLIKRSMSDLLVFYSNHSVKGTRIKDSIVSPVREE